VCYIINTVHGGGLTIYQYIVFNWRHSVWVICLTILTLNIAMFYGFGTINADYQAMEFSSREHLIGMVLLATLMPCWLIGCFLVTQRNTLRLAQSVDEHLPAAQKISSAVMHSPRRYIYGGMTAGLIYAICFNTTMGQFNTLLDGNLPYLSIFVGQTVTWACVGFLLGIRLYIADIFYQLGKVIDFTIFEQTRLEAFARVGMLDVAIIVGAMVLASVQSIDAQFRLENYLTAVLVAVPAAAALLILPMWTLHQRLRDRKADLLDAVNRKIVDAGEDTRQEQLAHLEALLQRRDRVRTLNTWPLDFAIWSRLFFYGLIPPLAWVGAALVEAALGRLLGL
jgi:hypothetical protein